MQWMLESFETLLSAWLQASLPVALLVAIGVHCLIYLLGGGIGIWLTEKLMPSLGIGRPLDQRPAKPGQLQREIRNGLIACLVLGLASLSYRWLCAGIWPESWLQAAFQVGSFVVFNNIYSYATHRLLHTRALSRFHRVHHLSVRVTPYSSYSVHPIEAMIIAGTLPLFMLLIPLGVGTALVLHAVGMVYTTCIHCNYDLMPSLGDHHWFKKLINHPTYHRFHHTQGNVNYGFTNRLLDLLFKTSKG